jgi:tellurite resistance protein TerC
MPRWVHLGYKAARRVVVAVVGGTVVAIGVAMILLPGPALLVIPVGLAILGVEFAWARHWLHRLKEAASDATARFRGNGGTTPAGPDGHAEAHRTE